MFNGICDDICDDIYIFLTKTHLIKQDIDIINVK